MNSNHISNYRTTLAAAKSAYYSNNIYRNGTNTRTLFSTVNKLLDPKETTTHFTTAHQCQQFPDFINHKVHSIHHQLPPSLSSQSNTPWLTDTAQPTSTLSASHPSSNQHIFQLIMSSRSTQPTFHHGGQGLPPYTLSTHHKNCSIFSVTWYHSLPTQNCLSHNHIEETWPRPK